MKREIVINASTLEVRVALLEDGVLSEFHLERNERQGLVGNLYKGKVTRVLPGMQAAFVEIGLEKAGFLHVSDFHTGIEGFGSAAEVIGEEDVETEPLHDLHDDHDSEGAGPEDIEDGGGRRRRGGCDRGGRRKPGVLGLGTRRTRSPAQAAERRARLPIEQVLKRGQDIIVQVAKEPMGTKGARLTSFVSLPGRHLVYTPTSNHIGISRRIESAQERQRLRAAVGELRPGPGRLHRAHRMRGREQARNPARRFIPDQVVVVGREAERDYAAGLVALQRSRRRACVSCATFFRATSIASGATIRRPTSVLSSSCRAICRACVRASRSTRADDPIFDHFQLEPQIDRALERKVWLKSGGYLVFDQAEALTAIDVNTGRFVGKRNQDETVLKTNLEAADEVVRQLRLRNIGGIIIVDFIDMTREADRKRVDRALWRKRSSATRRAARCCEFPSSGWSR